MTVLYTAEMKYNEDAVKRTCQMQFDTFQWQTKLVGIVVSLVLIGFGVGGLIQNASLRILSVAMGCIMLTSVDARAKSNARALLRAFDGKFPETIYSFTEKGFSHTSSKGQISYDSVIRLMEDELYLYIYVSRESAYMVSKAVVSGEDGAEGLKKMIANACGMEWSLPLSAKKLRISDVAERARSAFSRDNSLG